MTSRSRSSSQSSKAGSAAFEVETPDSSASSAHLEVDVKRRKLDHTETTLNVDKHAPVFLKMSFKRGPELDGPDDKLEDDEVFYARSWQERSTMVPMLVAFKVQFSEFFLGVPDLGPQDIEEGLASDEPSAEVQEYMCRLLTLAANRSKPVEFPHYNRPLNDCVALYYATRGDPTWESQNPLGSNKRFSDLTPDDRLRLLYCLFDWTLTESKAVKDKIEEAYKNRTAPRIHTHNPYELEVIGRDDRKHGYYLIKGINTRFRLYIQTDLAKTPTRWFSVCSTLEELRRFTSQLSDSARTVRCRKIVDDLASIHIPEVERAEETRKHIFSRKQRSLLERNRRSAYSYEASDISDRGSRTRGRRVDYNSMLQGQGEDDDGKEYARRGARRSSPEVVTPQSSRSGRMLKRPRGWEDGSPDSDYRKALQNSTTEQSTGAKRSQTPDELQDSHVVVLKYNKLGYAQWTHRPWDSLPLPVETPHQKRQNVIESVVIPEPLTDHQSLTNLYGPRIAAQMSLSATPPLDTTKTLLEHGEPQSQGSGNIDKADLSQQMGHSNKQVGLHGTPALPLPFDSDSADQANPLLKQDTVLETREVHRASRSLFLATLRDTALQVQHLEAALETAVQSALRNNIDHLDLLLFTTSDVRAVWQSYSKATFTRIQKAISALYIKAAQIARDSHGSEINTIVIFHDWCGYDLAKEDFVWDTIIAPVNDQNLVSTFLTTYKNTHATSRAPEVILAKERSWTRTLLPQESGSIRHYETVAVGGTFDHLHAGHKILLTMTAWLAQRKVVCGITDDALLVNKKHKEVMENIDQRTLCVKRFYHMLKRGLDYEMVPINDVAGPTGSDASIQALVASRETEAGSAQITEIRAKNNLPPLDILFIDVIGPAGEVHGEQMANLKLSSTAIRQKLASKL